MSDITLSSSIRQSLLSLTNTADSMSRTQSRLTTGLSVGSAVDEAVSYFDAKSLNTRAQDLGEKKAQLDSAISVVHSAVEGLSSVDNLITQAKGIAQAGSQAVKDNASANTIKGYADQYNDILKQIDQRVADSVYQGKNLLTGGEGNKLTVKFGSSDNAKLEVRSKQVDTSEKGLNLQQVTTFSADETSRLQSLDQATTTVRTRSSELGGNIAFLQTRADFTANYANTLTAGSGKLTLADLNAEGANLVALQTRQQIGIQSLSFAGQQQQAILSLLR